MNKILCFGDSNTFGYIPISGKRYPVGVRWTSILAEGLRDKFDVIEAGCNNRTAFSDNPEGTKLTGYKVIDNYLDIKPDIIILSIGVNDLQRFYNPSLDKFQMSFNKFIKDIQAKFKSKIIILAPSVLNDNILSSGFSFLFDEESIKKSKYLPEIYKEIALANGCDFIELNNKVCVGDDGLHYSAKSHAIIAKEIIEFIKLNYVD